MLLNIFWGTGVLLTLLSLLIYLMHPCCIQKYGKGGYIVFISVTLNKVNQGLYYKLDSVQLLRAVLTILASNKVAHQQPHFQS